MAPKISVLKELDRNLITKFEDKSIQHHIATKLEFSINIAGVEFNDIEEAIIYAYRCGLAAMDSDLLKKSKESKSVVDQDELYKILKKGHSMEHKADFLREIAKEWFPIDLHGDKKIKTVHIEINELANFLEK